MKVGHNSAVQSTPSHARHTPPKTFKAVLAQAAGHAPALSARKKVFLVGQIMLQKHELLARRNTMHVEAHRLVETRTEAKDFQFQQTEHRLREVIGRELEKDAPKCPATEATVRLNHLAKEPPTIKSEAPQKTEPEKHASMVLALASKIQAFTKSGRPAMSMSLGPSVGGFVEIEKTGKNSVAVKICGSSKLREQEAFAQLQTALEAKGLSVTLQKEESQL